MGALSYQMGATFIRWELSCIRRELPRQIGICINIWKITINMWDNPFIRLKLRLKRWYLNQKELASVYKQISYYKELSTVYKQISSNKELPSVYSQFFSENDLTSVCKQISSYKELPSVYKQIYSNKEFLSVYKMLSNVFKQFSSQKIFHLFISRSLLIRSSRLLISRYLFIRCCPWGLLAWSGSNRKLWPFLSFWRDHFLRLYLLFIKFWTIWVMNTKL